MEAKEGHSLENKVFENQQIRNYGSLSSIDKYINEWNELTTSLRSNNLEQLRILAFNGDLKISKFRSICWSLLLRVINEHPTDWIEQRRQQRERYNKIKDEFSKNPHKDLNTNDDPLSQSKQSIWNQYFGDQELYSVIKQDVTRTFPGVDFFRKPLIQKTMTNVLFNYAREHPYMCYRQGMHEILAPILFVMHSDHQALLHFQEVAHGVTDEILNEVLNPYHLEADAYFLFSRLMSSIESYYRIINVVPTAEGYFPPQTDIDSPPDSPNAPEVEVIGQLNFIRDKILAKEDLHLHNHLLKLDIPLHIFGIRWLRLLFGREFPLQDLLMLWDAIFADGDRFELPNFIVVAMLIRIRDKLLLSDYTSCLTYLMRYPNNADISMILRHALYMQSPTKYERPQGAFIYVTMKPEKKTQNPQQLSKTLTTPVRPLTSKMTKLHKSDSMNDMSNQRGRSSSLNNENLLAKDVQGEARINELQYANALNVARLANYSAIRSSDPGIVEGYREDSPEVLRLELENANTVMTISRLKLRKYLATLRRHITRNHPDDLNQALDGIEELCAFLDVKCPNINFLPTPVDLAFEVDEVGQIKSRPDSLPVISQQQQPVVQVSLSQPAAAIAKRNITEVEAKKEFVKMNPYEIHVAQDGKSFGNKTSGDVNEVQKTNQATRYEIPDDSKKVTRILGAKKDVELTVMKKQDVLDEQTGGIPIEDPTCGIRDT